MASVISSRYVTPCSDGLSAKLCLPFRPVTEHSLVHFHTSQCSVPLYYFLSKEGSALVCSDYGLKGGGCICIKSKKKAAKVQEIKTARPSPEILVVPQIIAQPLKPQKPTKGMKDMEDVKGMKDSCTGMHVSDEEALQAFEDLKSSLERVEVAGIVGNARKLLKNSVDLDGRLVEILVAAVGKGALWDNTEIAGDLMRQEVALLLRVSAVRFAIRCNESPGFVYTQKKEFTTTLEKSIKRLEKTPKSRLDVEVQAELRASWAVIDKIDDERNVWDRIRNVLPKLANLAGIVDPIRYAGTLTQGLVDLSSMLYDEYQRIKLSTLASSVITLTVFYIARLDISEKEVALLQGVLSKCNRWAIAVLLARLITVVMEERVVKLEIRKDLLEVLEELTSFKRFFFRNNWKVRKSALRSLMKLSDMAHEEELKSLITDLVEMRRVLENDEKVLPGKDDEAKMQRAQRCVAAPHFRTRLEKEITEIGNHVKQLYSSLHSKDESRVALVQSELRSAASSLNHVVALDPVVGQQTEELQKSVTLLANRTDDIVSCLDGIKSMLERPKTLVESKPLVRILPQRNLDGGKFVGRDTELRELMTHFSKRPAKAVILGSPGIGKSTLALKFAYLSEAAHGFQHYVWINARKSSTISADYLEVAREMKIAHGDESMQVVYARNHLKHNPETLIIYDNADFEDQENEEEVDKLIKGFFAFGSASVLITSRSETWVDIVSTQIRIDRLTLKEGVTLLAHVAAIPEEEVNPEVVESLEGNPLSLRTAGNYLKQSKSKRGLLRKMEGRTGSGVDKIVGVYYDSVTEVGKRVVETCAFLDGDNIDSRVTSRLLRAENVHQQTTALAELQTAALLEVTAGKVQMHRVLQDSAYRACPDKDAVEKRLSTCLVGMIQEGLKFDPDMILNARFFHDRKHLYNDSNRIIDKTLVDYCIKQRLGAEARRISLVELATQNAVSESLSPEEILLGHLRQAEAMALDNRHTEAEQCYKKAYDLSKDYPDKLFLVGFNLAKYQRNKGELEMARRYVEDALKMLPSVVAGVSVEDQLDLFHLAGVLFSSEVPATRAIDYFQQALKLAAQSSPSASTLAELHYHMGEMYHGQVGYDSECLQSLDSALIVLQSVPSDPLYAQVYRLLANLYKSDSEKRWAYLASEIAFRRVHLPDDQSALAQALLIHGEELRLKNRFQEAMAKLHEAESLLSAGDPVLVQVYAGLAAAAHGSGDEELALQYNDKKNLCERSART